MVYKYFGLIVVDLYEIFNVLGKTFKRFTNPRDENKKTERRILKKRGYVRK